MSGPSTGSDPLNALAEEFVERYRRGERPALGEYTARHPELSAEIRELFPALVMMEDLGSVAGRPAPAGPKAVPEQLGEYRILREIGRGGMGVVYEAAQESLGRHVALKILPFHYLMEESHLERFRREARAAAQLHHTNIVPVFGVGEYDGIHFYAMQFIQGQSLDEVVEEVKKLREAKPSAADAPPQPRSASVAGALLTGDFEAHGSQSVGLETPRPSPPTLSSSSSQLTRQPEVQYFRSVARLGVQVADALHYAHRQGILHRDIKPSNLLLDLHGIVWITDFGLAKAEGSGELTKTGDIVGTVRFMPPERLDGTSESRGDIYSLGVTLYEMLTLRPAFGDTQRSRLIERILHEDPPRPRKLDPAIPSDLETIVLKAMAKKPADRYATAEDMAEDLRRFLADRPIRARRASWREKAWRWCRRNPGVAGLSGTVAALVAVLLVGVAIALVLHQDKERAEQAEARAVAAEREVKIRSHLNRAMAYRRSRQSGQRFLCLAEAAEALKLNPNAEVRRDLSREVLACLALPDLYLNPARPSADYPAGSVWVDFDESLELYARTDAQGRCSIRRVAGDQELMHMPALGESYPAVFLSRNGRFAAVCSGAARGGRLQVWKLAEPEPKLLIAPPEPCLFGLDFRPDSRQLAVPHPDGAISVYDLATGQRLYQLAPDQIRGQMCVALHPTEPVIAVGSYSSAVVQIRDLRTGAVLASLPHPYRANCVAWHPNGQILATTAGDDNSIQLYDRATLQLIRTLTCNSHGTHIVFNHAGDRLASVGWGGSVQLWDVDTGQLLFSTSPVGVHTLRFSQDDRWLAAAIQGHKVGIWQVSDGREYRTLVRTSLPRKTTPTSAVAVHPDGRLLAVGWKDGLGFWDLDSGAELGFVPIQSGVRSLLFEPSGDLLTNGPSHLYRWRIRPDRAAPGTLRIGPPEPLALPGSDGGIAQSRDGRVLVQAQRAVGQNQRRAGAWVLYADRPGQPICLEQGKDISPVAVSPDGRWITTGVYYSSTNKVWEASSGRLVKEFTGEGYQGCLFSPDGHWLITGQEGNRLFAIPSWTKGPQLGDGGLRAFSPDSRLVVLETGAGAVRLVESATGKEIARLEDPNLDVVGAAAFTPDGERLLTITTDRVKGVHVWDLKAVRHAQRWLAGELDHLPDQLSAPPPPRTPLRLDIDRSGLPDVAETGVVAWSLALALQPLNPVAHYRRALCYATLRKEAEAIADCRQAAAWQPDWPALVARTPARSVDLNNLAWWLIVKPASAADTCLAVALAEQGVKLDATNANHHNTLGVAYYRAGRFVEAVRELQTSFAESRGQADAHNLYFLAMCHQALGEPAKARACYDEAVAWRKKRKSIPPLWDAELKAFHAEAAAALGLMP